MDVQENRKPYKSISSNFHVFCGFVSLLRCLALQKALVHSQRHIPKVIGRRTAYVRRGWAIPVACETVHMNKWRQVNTAAHGARVWGMLCTTSVTWNPMSEFDAFDRYSAFIDYQEYGGKGQEVKQVSQLSRCSDLRRSRGI